MHEVVERLKTQSNVTIYQQQDDDVYNNQLPNETTSLSDEGISQMIQNTNEAESTSTTEPFISNKMMITYQMKIQL